MLVHKDQLALASCTLTPLFSFLDPVARADGVGTPRDPTAAEKRSYADAYALFLPLELAADFGARCGLDTRGLRPGAGCNEQACERGGERRALEHESAPRRDLRNASAIAA
jgi:hypothetical protein